MNIDVATFGSATKDVFLRTDPVVLKSERFVTGKGICFPLGSKVNSDEIFFTVGGGGTNTAATFASQGLKTAYIGKVGSDLSGTEVLQILKRHGVVTDFIKKTANKKTNFSVVLDVEENDRTILVYRGASGEFKAEEIPEELEADWFYLAPFPKRAAGEFYKIIDLAKSKDIKLAVNPSKDILKDDGFETALGKIDVLLLNQEEASILTGIDYEREDQIFKKIDESFRNIFAITKGSRGVSISDDKMIYRAKALDTDVIDRTGAGDSFGAGFVSGLIKFGDLKEAIQLGVANASSCLAKRGAKKGLLKEGENYKKIKVDETEKTY